MIEIKDHIWPREGSIEFSALGFLMALLRRRGITEGDGDLFELSEKDKENISRIHVSLSMFKDMLKEEDITEQMHSQLLLAFNFMGEEKSMFSAAFDTGTVVIPGDKTFELFPFLQKILFPDNGDHNPGKGAKRKGGKKMAESSYKSLAEIFDQLKDGEFTALLREVRIFLRIRSVELSKKMGKYESFTSFTEKGEYQLVESILPVFADALGLEEPFREKFIACGRKYAVPEKEIPSKKTTDRDKKKPVPVPAVITEAKNGTNHGFNLYAFLAFLADLTPAEFHERTELTEDDLKINGDGGGKLLNNVAKALKAIGIEKDDSSIDLVARVIAAENNKTFTVSINGNGQLFVALCLKMVSRNNVAIT